MLNKGVSYRSEDKQSLPDILEKDTELVIMKDKKELKNQYRQIRELFLNSEVLVYFNTNEGLYQYKGKVKYHLGANRKNGFRSWDIYFYDNTIEKKIYLGPENFNQEELYGWTFVDDERNKIFTRNYMKTKIKVKKLKLMINNTINEEDCETTVQNNDNSPKFLPHKKAISKMFSPNKNNNLSLSPLTESVPSKQFKSSSTQTINKNKTQYKKEIKYIRHINYLTVEINDLTRENRKLRTLVNELIRDIKYNRN